MPKNLKPFPAVRTRAALIWGADQPESIVYLLYYATVTVDADPLVPEDAQRLVGHVVAMGVGHKHCIDFAVHPLVLRQHVSALILRPDTTVDED